MIRPITRPWLQLALTGALTLLIAVPTIASAADPAGAPQTDEEKTLYFLGVLAAGGLTRFHLSDDELPLVQRGIADTLKGQALELDRSTYGQRAQNLMRARQQEAAAAEKEASADFLAQEAAKPSVRTLASGLLIEDLSAGTGASPTVTDTVEVHYHGTLRDGSVFDSSVERGQPFTTQLSRVVRCWQEGVAQMRVGGKSRLVCPSDLAYGDGGSPPSIPGGAALVFEVELLGIVN